MVLATTNCPWDLDEAIRRRLEKRIFIPLPDKAARKDLYSICLKGINLAPDVDISHLAGLVKVTAGQISMWYGESSNDADEKAA